MVMKKNVAKKKEVLKKSEKKRTVRKKVSKKVVKKIKKIIRKKPTTKIIKKEKPEKTGIKISTGEKIPLPKKSKRISTNVKNFDKLIEGGFKERSTNLIVGGSGAGKTIFATQFLVEGMKKGEKCLYVTFEENKEEFYSNMLRFGWDLAKYEQRGLFYFLIYSPIKVKTMLDEGGGAIETIILSKKISRMVIDSITSFAMLFDDELEKREAALSLFNMIGKWNATSLLTYEGQPLKDSTMTTRTMEFESDSIILFYYLREKGERKRYLEILKMRGTNHSKKTYGFSISKKGIEIHPKPTNINP